MTTLSPTQGTPDPSKSGRSRPSACQQARVEETLSTCPEELRAEYYNFAVRAVVLCHRQAAMRLKCLECCAWQRAEVTRCELTGCALHQYRMGVKAERVE